MFSGFAKMGKQIANLSKPYIVCCLFQQHPGIGLTLHKEVMVLEKG
jgi:hypothetical protein